MKIFKNFDLTYFNTFQLKSIAKTIYFPETEEELKEIFCKINAPILASGSNVLLRPEISELINMLKEVYGYNEIGMAGLNIPIFWVMIISVVMSLGLLWLATYLLNKRIKH